MKCEMDGRWSSSPIISLSRRQTKGRVRPSPPELFTAPGREEGWGTSTECQSESGERERERGAEEGKGEREALPHDGARARQRERER